MNKEDIIRMARKAGGLPDPMVFIGAYERFAALITTAAKAEEREACAKVVEPDEDHRRDASWGYLGGKEGVELLDSVAAAIRARGNT